MPAEATNAHVLIGVIKSTGRGAHFEPSRGHRGERKVVDGVTRSRGASISQESTSAIAVRIVLAGFLLAACSATPASSSQPAATAPTEESVTATVTPTPELTPAASGPIAIREGQASAGTYTTTSFDPTVVLKLPSDGWRFFFQDDNDELALGSVDGELTGGRVANVLDSTTRAIVPAPDDLVSWFASHQGLEAEAPQTASVGGIAGQSIDVMNTGSSNVDIFAYPTGNLRVSAGTTFRLWILPYDGPDLVFTAGASSSRFQEVLPILQQVIDSIVIVPG